MTISNTSTNSFSILGVTGSIGKNTVKIIEQSEKEYCCYALTADKNYKELAKYAINLKARMVVIADESYYQDLKKELSSTNIKVASGEKGLIEAAQMNAKWVMSAIVGYAGLAPTMEAIKSGGTIALANKECLVCAGSIMMEAVKEYGTNLIPVDSEHSAIFQVFDFKNADSVEKIILTASGGPFLKHKVDDMTNITLEQAKAHPNWDMGVKISIDSATMMNKGLELIEAFHLFPVSYDKFDVLVHPESIIHSMVEYIDGSTLAQLGTPDMCTPIAYSLSHPERIKVDKPKLNLSKIAKLTFFEADDKKFKSLKLAKQVLKENSSLSTVFNTANEVAVEAFINGKIGFLDIANFVEDVLNKSESVKVNSLEEVFSIIENTKNTSYKTLKQL